MDLSTRVLEVCAPSATFAIAAAAAGAHRVELCDDLVEGGTTPSAGAIALAVEEAGVPIAVMIRPRGGDFLYDELEVEVMLRDVAVAKERGAACVVFGALTRDGRIDLPTTMRLLEAAHPLPVTFHRAFDMSRDLEESLEALSALGVSRVLTSVGRRSVLDDLPRLEGLVRQAGAAITVMPGGGVRPGNVDRVLAVPGVREVHVGASRSVPSGMRHRVDDVWMGKAYTPDEYLVDAPDVDAIGRLTRALTGVEAGAAG